MKILSSSMAFAVLAMCVAGCGSSGNDVASSASGTPATAPDTSAPAKDAFTANVADIVGTSSDTAEPVAVDASANAGSDTAEPVPVS